MSIIEEIKEQQKKSLKNMSPKEKLAYFWDYYKIHVGVTIIVLVLAVIFIYQFVTNKDYGFYAALVNASPANFNNDLTAIWAEEFQEYAQIDPGKYRVYIDTSVTVSEGFDLQYTLTNQEKMFAMMQTGMISTIVAETETFEKYSQNEYFYDLESLLSSDELEKYDSYLYYTDAATYIEPSDDTFYNEDGIVNPKDLIINHRDPSAMEQPVVVGIILTEDNMIANAGYYDYLSSAEYDYQGYPADIILGIPVTCKEPELAIRFLEFLELGI